MLGCQCTIDPTKKFNIFVDDSHNCKRLVVFDTITKLLLSVSRPSISKIYRCKSKSQITELAKIGTTHIRQNYFFNWNTAFFARVTSVIYTQFGPIQPSVQTSLSDYLYFSTYMFNLYYIKWLSDTDTISFLIFLLLILFAALQSFKNHLRTFCSNPLWNAT